MSIVTEYVSSSMVLNEGSGNAECCPEANTPFAVTLSPILTTADIVVNTIGLSLNITYNNSDVGFDPDALFSGSNGLSTKQLIESYLSSWCADIYAYNLTLKLNLNFQDSGANSILATGGSYIVTMSNSTPVIQASTNLPITYNGINDDTAVISAITNTTFGLPTLRYFEYLQNTLLPLPVLPSDMVMTVNTYYIKLGTMYNYDNSFLCTPSNIPFKSVIIHEMHHALGCVGNPHAPYLFSNSNLPANTAEFMQSNRLRVYDGGAPGGIGVAYRPISVSNGICSAPISPTSISHLLSNGGNNGIMESTVYYGGKPWTQYDGNLLKIIGFNNSIASCIATDTDILMADGSLKKIQDIKRGDIVAGDADMTKTHIVSRVTMDRLGCDTDICMYVFEPECLGTMIPHKSLYITKLHPIIYEHDNIKTRRTADCFENINGVTKRHDIAKNILPPLIDIKTGNNDAYFVWDLQYDTIGSYVANGVTIQSRHPRSIYTPLNKHLYHDINKYSEERTDDNDPEFELPLDTSMII